MRGFPPSRRDSGELRPRRCTTQTHSSLQATSAAASVNFSHAREDDQIRSASCDAVSPLVLSKAQQDLRNVVEEVAALRHVESRREGANGGDVDDLDERVI